MITVADRIKNRREELHMSQAELAKKLGLSDRSSVSKIEKSGNDITLKNIERIANILQVTPSYLMGWTSSLEDITISNKESDIDFDILPGEYDSISKFRELDWESQNKIIKLIDELYDELEKKRAHVIDLDRVLQQDRITTEADADVLLYNTTAFGGIIPKAEKIRIANEILKSQRR